MNRSRRRSHLLRVLLWVAVIGVCLGIARPFVKDYLYLKRRDRAESARFQEEVRWGRLKSAAHVREIARQKARVRQADDDSLTEAP